MVDRYRNYQPRRYQPPARTKPRSGWFIVFTLVLLGIGSKYAWAYFHTAPAASTPVAAAITPPKPKVTAEPIASSTWNDINLKVNALIDANSAIDISVAVIDVNTNTKASYGIQDNFVGASTTKVLTAVAYLHGVEEGTFTLSTSVGGSSAKTQIKQMINQSNNESWYALNKKVTYKELERYAHELGLSSYDATKNVITASDEAVLLQKLYKRELLNEENTQLLLSFMQNTNNEAMIPKVLPAGATIYHKYGQLEDRLHDTAIINYQDRPLVLVVLTKGGASDGSNYGTRTQLIRDIAQSVLDTIYTP